MRAERLTIVRVEYMPRIKDHGVLYVSAKYSLAIHLCACGCGQETVTPLGAEGWTYSDDDDLPSLAPSIGNFRMPCMSHYFVTRGKVTWC